ncbi:MAG TPA: ribonuclease HII, partial [Armatimonadota bacterium]
AFTPRPGCPTLQDGLTSGMEHAARLEDALGAPGAPLPPEITGQRDVPPSAGPAAAVARGASLPQEAAGQCDSVLQWDALGAALVLVDGRPVPGLGRRQVALVKGDSRSLCIAAASIVAKVTRDHLMREAHDLYPHYGFAHHQGYPTPAHLEALRRHGPCPLHRRSFGPVRALLGVVEGDLYGKGSDSCG